MPIAGYTGHGPNTGGLQQHSVGEMYPFTVIGIGGRGPTKWAMFDTRTGKSGTVRHTYNEAAQDVWSRKITTMMHS